MLKSLLTDIIDDKVDSLRFYYLGNNYRTKVEHIGVERGTAVDQPFIPVIYRCEWQTYIKLLGDSHQKK